MAMFNISPPKNQIFSLKTTLIIISTGVLSMAVFIKLALFPSLTDNFADNPNLNPFSLFNIVSLLIKPPYLYLVVNCIIISIVASSKLHKSQNYPTTTVAPTVVDDVYTSVVVESTDNYSVYGGYDDQERIVKVVSEENHDDRTVENVVFSSDGEDQTKEVMRMDGGDDDDDGINSIKGAVRIDPMELRLMDQKLEALKQKVREKERPLSSARFHRKPLRSSHDGVNGGKSLRVSKPKKTDTLESTWKTITDGRSIPLTRHLKKSDTWDSHVRSSNDQTTPPKHMLKSETFNTTTNHGINNHISATATRLRREPSVKLKKDPSISQEELNKRVEAFINKFNEEMKLQRQESLMQYQEMLKRGAHY